MNFSVTKPHTQHIQKTFSYTDYDSVSQTLDILESKSSDFDTFHRLLMQKLEEKTVTKNVLVSRSKNNQPWFNAELKKFKKSVKKFYRLKTKYPTNTIYATEYIKFRTLLNETVKGVKSNYYSNLFNQNIQNPTKLWRLTNQLVSNNFTNDKPNTISIESEGLLVHNEWDVANLLNSHFTSVFTKIKSETKCQTSSRNPSTECKTRNRLKIFSETNPHEVLLVIKNLPNNCSPGYDKVPASFLKLNGQFFSELLSKTANNVFLTGNFPATLKHSIVTPIFKKGNPKDPTNYRPISVLSVFSKVLEILIKNRILKFLLDNKLISKKQFGFLSKKSTTAAAASLVDKLVKSLNSKLKTSCLFLDLVKAFDSLDYNILNKILQSYGFEDLALKVIMNFLTDRTQSVKVNSKIGSPRKVHGGLPQGSCLVILFLIYVNDFFDLPLKGTLQLFCDDATISYEAEDYQTLQTYMQTDLQQIINFLKSRNLLLNTDKTKFIIFLTKNSSTLGTFDTVSFENHSVEMVKNHEYLGLCLDSKLSFQEHITKVIRKTSPFVGMLNRLKQTLPTSMLWQIYYSHIHSHFTYLLPVWASASENKLIALQRIQNKAIKNILKLPHLTSSSSLYSSERLPFTKLRIYESILFIYKIVHNLTIVDYEITRNISITNRVTRQSNILRPPNYVLSLAQNSAFCRGIKLYNNFISKTDIESNSLDQVKSKIKHFSYNF